jgi:transcriptional regulator with XRE-family HTH domain
MATDDEEAAFAKIVAKNVKRIRKQKRLTGLELSTSVGASHGYIHALEEYEKLPNFLMGMRIAKVLGVKPESLLEK